MDPTRYSKSINHHSYTSFLKHCELRFESWTLPEDKLLLTWESVGRLIKLSLMEMGKVQFRKVWSIPVFHE